MNPSSKKLVHIRLPEAVHKIIKSEAESSGKTIQHIVLEAVKKRELEPNSSRTSENGVLNIYNSRFSQSLKKTIKESLLESKKIDLQGIYLLDFLSDDSWGYEVFSNMIKSKDKSVRILIQDWNSPAAHWKFLHHSKDSEVKKEKTKNPKYLKALEANRLLKFFKSQFQNIQIRMYRIYPLVRWMLILDNKCFIELHCFRSHSNSKLNSPAKLPIIEFSNLAGGYTRYSEYFESCWDEKVLF